MIEPRALRRILVVEDDTALRAAIARLARGWGAEVVEASSVRESIALLSPPPDLIVADVRLPDGSARAIFEESARSWPRPTIVAISGRASAAESFELGQMGVRAYLAKPFTLSDLSDVIADVLSRPPELDPFIAEAVGRTGMRELGERVGRIMLRQALAIANGSRSDAARLLDVSRQAVQQRLRGRSERAPRRGPEPDTTGGRS